MSGWGNGIYDFDNDGFKDLFTATRTSVDNADDDLSNTNSGRQTPCSRISRMGHSAM